LQPAYEHIFCLGIFHAICLFRLGLLVILLLFWMFCCRENKSDRIFTEDVRIVAAMSESLIMKVSKRLCLDGKFRRSF